MAKPARGLPEGFSLELPEERPVMIGDFLDEEPPMPVVRRQERAVEPPPVERQVASSGLRQRIEQVRGDEYEERPRPTPRPAKQPSIIRYQLNLTPKAKTMLEELVDYVRTYSPENDARTSEVFQGVITLLHNAMDELDLSELPRRGAWGSVTAKNFPVALSEAFEQAILRSAQKRGGLR